MMRPPFQCQRHRTRSSDRVVVLHDLTTVGCPSTTLGGCVGHVGAVPRQRHRTRTSVLRGAHRATAAGGATGTKEDRDNEVDTADSGPTGDVTAATGTAATVAVSTAIAEDKHGHDGAGRQQLHVLAVDFSNT
jgi:hypothetical protein